MPGEPRRTPAPIRTPIVTGGKGAPADDLAMT